MSKHLSNDNHVNLDRFNDLIGALDPPTSRNLLEILAGLNRKIPLTREQEGLEELAELESSSDLLKTQ